MTPILLNATRNAGTETLQSNLLVAILIIGIVLLILAGIALLYLISTLRRRNVVLKKVDYLVEDITYKSESLNVTVETLNKLSNYALTIDTASQKGFKNLIKFVSENRNYIYAIIEKLKKDVEDRENTKTSAKKTPTKKPVAKKTTAAKKTPAKKPAAKKTATKK